MTYLKLYNCKPNIGDYINFIFTDHRENYLMCKLVDYDLNAIMTFQCLTNKKKIKSIKSLAPLNKPMIGIIENIDDNNIELNLINVNVNEDAYKDFSLLNQNNHVLKKLINKYIHTISNNLDEIMEKYIYNINEKDILSFILENNTDNVFYNFIKQNSENQVKSKNEIMLNIRCDGNINNIIKLFDLCIESINSKNIKIINTKVGFYKVSSDEKLDNFLDMVKENVLKFEDIILIN